MYTGAGEWEKENWIFFHKCVTIDMPLGKWGGNCMIFDTHMHTIFSTDSKMTIEQALLRGKELGIGIIVTEHMDLKYPEPDSFVFDAEKYFAAYEPYRSEVFRIGIEVGMRQDCLDANLQLVEQYPFDFVIGSIHVIDNVDIYDASFYRKSKKEVYEKYFEAMLQCITCYDCIDSLGHIDYIARYAQFEEKEIYYHEFTEAIDKVLKITAEKNKALEINTRRLDSRKTIEALMPIYRRFHELGGRMVTIGSDAHRPEDIGKGMNAALQMAQDAQLQPVYFVNRSPVFIR